MGDAANNAANNAASDAASIVNDIKVIFKNFEKDGKNYLVANEIDDGTGPKWITGKVIQENAAAGSYVENKFTQAEDVTFDATKNLLNLKFKDGSQIEIDIERSSGGAKKSRKSKKRVHRRRRHTMNKK